MASFVLGFISLRFCLIISIWIGLLIDFIGIENSNLENYSSFLESIQNYCIFYLKTPIQMYKEKTVFFSEQNMFGN